MFPYTVKYTESEYDIQNNGLLYKTHETCQNIFELLDVLNRFLRKIIVSFCNIYNFHNSYFENVVNVVICVFLDFCIFIYYIYTCRSLQNEHLGSG